MTKPTDDKASKLKELRAPGAPAVLMVAFHYPPIRISSGVQRTLAFSRYLPEHGWQPLVLSAHPRVDESPSSDLLREVPAGLKVVRAFALDSARHLAIGGRYWGLLALPDRWASWCLGGFVSGLKMIFHYKPQVIFSTYPVASAHFIALCLHKLTGLPWLADFRDSMTEPGYPRQARQRRLFVWLERQVVRSAKRVIFTTPGAVRMYRQRYPELPSERWVLIPNGYNEDIFREVETELRVEKMAGNVRGSGKVTLVHSGVLYPEERDPRAFFAALAQLKASGMVEASSLKVILRATGSDELYRPRLRQLGIEDLVELAPAIDYRAALREILSVDGLLIFQAGSCNHQIPAKLYEYCRAQKPVLALTDPAGDTAATMRELGVNSIIPLDDRGAIVRGLIDFLKAIEAGTAELALKALVQGYSRQALTGRLALTLDDDLLLGMESGGG